VARRAIGAAVLGLAALAVHRLGRRSGATGEEVRARLPGDDGVGDFPDASAMLRGIKQRSERAGTARDAASP
jgi:hypothetical protein